MPCANALRILQTGAFHFDVFFCIFCVFLLFNKDEHKAGNTSFDYARLLFQPFFPIALGRVTWNIVDVIVGVFLVVLIFKDYKK